MRSFRLHTQLYNMWLLRIPKIFSESIFVIHVNGEDPKDQVEEFDLDFNVQLHNKTKGSLKLTTKVSLFISVIPMIGFWKPSSIFTIFPVKGSHTITVWSSDPLAKYPFSSSIMHNTA